MKTLFKFTVTLALPILYFIIVSAFKPTEPVKVTDASSVNNVVSLQPPIAPIPKDFTHFILNYGIQDGFHEWDNFTMFWPFYKDELHYNGIQLYDYGADTTGKFGVPLRPDQVATMNSLITGTKNRGLKCDFQRINISKLCQDGQRIVFEAEGGNEDYSYGYKMPGSGPIPDSGRSVIKGCASCPPSMPAGMLCESITENLQFALSYTYDWAPQQDWHLKPVMRIDSSIVDNSPTAPVIAIVTRNFKGIIIDSTVIKARNFASFLGGNYIYNGRYISTFDFIQDPNTDLDILGRRDTATGLMYGYTRKNVNESKVDFKIYWCGQVDVWFDKLVVDNDIGNNLFSLDSTVNYNRFLDSEIVNFGNKLDMFFVDECVTTNLPCIKYVNDYIKNYSSTAAPLSYAVSYNLNMHYTKNDANSFKLYLDTVKPDIIQIDAHAFQFGDGQPGYIPYNALNPDSVAPLVPLSWRTTNYNTYNTYLQNCLGQKDSYVWPYEGSFIYQVNKTKGEIASHSVNSRISIQPQIQGWLVYNSGEYKYGCREPLNEEISAQAWIALTYGADYLSWFWLPTMTPLTADISQRNGPLNMSLDPGDQTYTFGVFDSPNPPKPRTKNQYGQNKYAYLCSMNEKILNLKPTLDVIDWLAGYSIHSEGSSHGCIGDIKSIYRNPSTLIFGPEDEIKYWELGLFEESQPNLNYEKYFMLVNRRCVPETEPGEGDIRQLKIKFNPDILRNYTNWTLTELENNTSITFDKNNQGTDGFLDIGNSVSSMGYFNPGEGKLFKLVPVILNGGILVADEIISGESFTCEAPVYNNGHNITIGENTTIHFNDSSRFVMDGGVFTVGDQNTSAPQNITSDEVPGGSWRGHSFTNCEVKIYGATFSGLANDTTYAINIIDCPVVDIRNCTINTNSSLKGGINAICFSNPFIAINNIYIGSNTFNSSGSTIPTVNVSSYAGVTTPLIIENNTFNEGNTAVFLSGVIGGAIKGNTITDNYIGINALTSSIDVVQNNISSQVNGSMGIFAAGGSELKLNSSGTFTLGGLNNISNEGTGTNNINVDGSYFLLDDGENIFNISSDQSSYHLYGYFPMFTAVTTEETNNCFKVNSSPVDPPINMVTSGYQGSQITFNFNPYLAGCEIIGGGDGLVINLGNGIYDTIYTGGSGSGGSMKEALPLNKGEYPQGEGVEKQTTPSGYAGHPSLVRRGAYTPQFPKEKYDSVCVLMRYRNYSQAKTKCLDLINAYPDSIQSLFAVSKLFLATVASDTSYNAANNLKIFYENLILNHQGNTSLVKRANYYILKCKVRMREYSQALAGFQQIINQNPYSYEGLIARWDYMATSLLVQGQGGGERGISDFGLMNADLEEASSIDIVNALQKEAEDDDKSPFSKEQRQDIRKSINTAIDVSKYNDETKMKSLEEKSELGDVNASKELTQMKSLKQVVKTEKPKSITEHIKIVSEDIRKVFGSNTSSKGNQPKNLPTVFRISQNYPNPFNPVTKINYDLPKDSKVNIVIYDILGREVKRLVNNEIKQAGSYIVDFNAMNYASGVYFYRIEAEEPNGNKFVDSKKMVLLK